MSRLLVRTPLLCLFALALTGALSACSHYDIQAPYDSYVCFNSSFNMCLSSAQGGGLQNWRKSTYKNNSGGDHLVDDPDSGVLHPTQDHKYQCDYGAIPYTQTIVLTQVQPAVFVSSILLRQLGEQMVRLNRARAACDRVIANYEYELGVLGTQDQLSSAQKAVSLLSAEVEHDRNAKDGMGGRALSPAEKTQYGNAAIVRDALQLERGQIGQVGDQLRLGFKTQTTDVDFGYQFKDANFAIDSQLREVARSLVVLDRSVFSAPTDKFHKSHYIDGSWIKQGTVVLTAQPSAH